MMESVEKDVAASSRVLSELAGLAHQHGWEDIERQAAGLAENLEHPPETILLIGPEALSPEERGFLTASKAPVRLIDLDDAALEEGGTPADRLAEGCRVGLVLRAGRLVSPEVFRLISSLKESRPPGLLLLAFAGAGELDEADRERAELAAWRLLEPDQPFRQPSRQAGQEGPCFLDSTAELVGWLSSPPDDRNTADLHRLQVATLIDAAERAAVDKNAAPAPAAIPTTDIPAILRRLKEGTRLLSRQVATSHDTLLLDLPQLARSGTDPVRRRLESWAHEVAEMAGGWWSRCLEELCAENLMPEADTHPPDFLVATASLPSSPEEHCPQPSSEGLLGPAVAGAALGSGVLLSGAILLDRLLPLPFALTATAAASGGLIGGAVAGSIESRHRRRQRAAQERIRQAAAQARMARAEIERRLATAEESLSARIREASQAARATHPRPPDTSSEESPLQRLGGLRNRLFEEE